MSSCIIQETATSNHVGMGQIAVGEGDAELTAILGSCLGVSLYDRQRRTGTLAHVVLPNSGGRPSAFGKFADTAVPQMMEIMARRGSSSKTIEAKLTGGACMFTSRTSVEIGKANVEAVRRALAALNIPVAATDVGGECGRRITFRCWDGGVHVERIGKPSSTI